MIRPLNIQDIPKLIELWNTDMNPAFYLRQDLVKTQLIESEDLCLSCSFVAIEDNTIVGGILVKTWDKEVIPKYRHVAWMDFLFVQRDKRRKKYGIKLVNASLQQLRMQGVTHMHVGKSMTNLFCGVADVFESNLFFEQYGCLNHGLLYDLHKHMVGAETLPLRRKTEYQIRVGTEQDTNLAKAFFHRVFPGRWEEEYNRYVGQNGSNKEFIFIEKDDKIIAFCRMNDGHESAPMYNTNFQASFEHLYGVGPLGVDPEYRGLSLGYDVTAFAINTAQKLGATDIIIDWTELVELYRKFGFEVWHQYTAYTFEVK